MTRDTRIALTAFSIVAAIVLCIAGYLFVHYAAGGAGPEPHKRWTYASHRLTMRNLSSQEVTIAYDTSRATIRTKPEVRHNQWPQDGKLHLAAGGELTIYADLNTEDPGLRYQVFKDRSAAGEPDAEFTAREANYIVTIQDGPDLSLGCEVAIAPVTSDGR